MARGLTPPPTERVAQFGPDRGLLGIVTVGAGARARERPHVLLLNAGITHRVGPNRLAVRTARALAAEGFSSLRFDLSGVGDSARRDGVASLRESVERDIAEAIEYLVTVRDARQVVLMGLCSGAYDALHAAAGDPRVVGALMVDLPGPFRGWRHTMHHLRRRVFRPRSWRNPLDKLLRHSRALVAPAPGGGTGTRTTFWAPAARLRGSGWRSTSTSS